MINTQEANPRHARPKLISTIKDNKSVKSLVSGISLSIKTGTGQVMGGKTDFQKTLQETVSMTQAKVRVRCSAHFPYFAPRK